MEWKSVQLDLGERSSSMLIFKVALSRGSAATFKLKQAGKKY